MWVWLALCRETRQIVVFMMGDRSRATCERLWQAIPRRYKEATCYSDFWEAYQEVIPEEQHEATGKEEGQTCHVERWINTLRQRLSRYVRKTISFSKSAQMHHCCLKLFIHRYNLERKSAILERNTTVGRMSIFLPHLGDEWDRRRTQTPGEATDAVR